MLVLYRKKNEGIMIGEDLEVIVVEIRGDKVRLGINAPKEVPVHRREVWDAIQRENKKAGFRSKPANELESGVSDVENSQQYPYNPRLSSGGKY